MRVALSTFAFMTLSLSVVAQEKPFIVGLGIASQSDLYKDLDQGASPVPLVKGEIGNFWIEGLQAGYDVYRTDNFSIGPALQFNPSGFKTKDAKSSSHLYDGLDDRDSALEAGIVARYDMGWAQVHGALMADVSGTHDGQSVELGIGRTVNLTRNWSLTPELSATWVSAQQNDYYFGVAESERSSVRDAYAAGSSTNYTAALNTNWQVSQQWNVMGRVALESFGSNVSDSPLVDKSSQSTVMVGLGYAF